jgi:cation:H+ antiporter
MLLSFLLMLDGVLSFIDGSVLFLGFILTLAAMAWLAIHSQKDDPLEQEFEQEYAQAKLSTGLAIVYFLIGLVSLLIGSKSLVWGATGIAQLLGVSDLIIGLTIVAIGTSLPELAASVMSALKNEHDIAVGNVLGSNIFNLLAVLAMPGLIAPSEVSPIVLQRDFSFMAGLTILLYCFARFSPQGKISRSAGLLMMAVYIGYNGMLAYQHSLGM